MKTALIELHYFPCLEYFTCLNQFDHVIIEANEHFQKQTYRNRCYILSSQKIDILSVPVLHQNKNIKEVKIDYSQHWAIKHWRTIKTCYANAPFYEHYEESLYNILTKKFTFLFDLNFELLNHLLKLININISISFSNSYNLNPTTNNMDLRSKIHPKRSYLDNNFYNPYPYIQIFGQIFASNLSIVDLLFCEGPNTKFILESSSK